MKPDVKSYIADDKEKFKVLFLEETLHPIPTIVLMDLLGEGCSIDIAYNGELALPLIAKNRYDLIVSGMMLDKVSGLDVLDIVRNTPEVANTKIIIHSGLYTEKDRLRTTELGANDHIDANATNSNELVAVIWRLLGIKTKSISDPEDTSWNFPPKDLIEDRVYRADAGDVKGNAQIIKDTLDDFDIDAEMLEANIGPRYTQYTMRPPKGLKITKISKLDANLALNLGAESIRVQSPIPGKQIVGVEVPNVKSASVYLSSVLQDHKFTKAKDKLTFAAGKDVHGELLIDSLTSAKNLLIGGQTGSGKSSFVNQLIISLLYQNTPDELKLILIDAKQVELLVYKDIPHLLTPPILTPEVAISAFKWVMLEIDRRLELVKEKSTDVTTIPKIVIICEEWSDFMMTAGRFFDDAIAKITKQGSKVGIHLVIDTSRPSTDVYTGLIRHSFQTHIAFATASEIDSRTVINMPGAEKLLGRGDMLYVSHDNPDPARLQSPFIEDNDVVKVVEFLKTQKEPTYSDLILAQNVSGAFTRSDTTEYDDSIYPEVKRYVIKKQEASASSIQRKFRVGYARAARLIETLEEDGVVSPADDARPRKVLQSEED